MRDDEPVGPPRPDLEQEWVDDDLCVYDPRADAVIVLNGTASAVWQLCDGTRPEPAVVGRLAEVYAVAPDAIRGDVAAAVRMFRAAGLVA